MRVIHIGDTFVPVAPETIATRLESVGFEAVDVEVGPGAFRFNARKPHAQDEAEDRTLAYADSSILRRTNRETLLGNDEGDANVHQ